jgi:hypothetical protein
VERRVEPLGAGGYLMPSVLGFELSGFSAAYFAMSSCSATGVDEVEPPHPVRRTTHGNRKSKARVLSMNFSQQVKEKNQDDASY